MFEQDTVNDVVVILSDPELSDGDLSYAVEVTEGDLVPSDGPASLFIDMIGRPLSSGWDGEEDGEPAAGRGA